MADQSFTVTLPSNSSTATEPANRGSKYVVRLSTPLNFNGQSTSGDINWEVALTSMLYTNRFYNMREPAVIHVVVQFPSLSAIDIRIPSMRGVTQYSENLNANHVRAFNPLDQRIMKQFVKTPETADPTFVASAKLRIPVEHYTEPSAVYNKIVSEFNKAFSGGRFNTTLSADGATADHAVVFEVEPSSNRVFMYVDALPMANMLGMSTSELDSDTPALYRIGMTSNKPPCFDTAQSLYVYSDIIKPQHVGSVLAPLLDIAPVQGVPGQRMQYSFSQPTYLPIKHTYIPAIGIEIRDEFGNYVSFSDSVENVICRLRFRRCNTSTLN